MSEGRSATRGARSERGQGDEIRPRIPGVRHLERQSIGRVQDPEALPIEHDDRGGIAGDERIPPPALGPLDALEQDAGPIPASAGKTPTGVDTSASSSVHTGASAKPSA